MGVAENLLNRSAPVVPPPPGNTAVEWVVALQHVSASQNSPAPLGPNTFNFCSPTSGCSALIDSGTFDIALPPEFFPSLLQLLGLPANPPLVGFNITSRGLISADGYPQIACAARARSGPTIDFQIQVHGVCSRDCDLTSPRHPTNIRSPRIGLRFKHAHTRPTRSMRAPLLGTLLTMRAQCLPPLLRVEGCPKLPWACGTGFTVWPRHTDVLAVFSTQESKQGCVRLQDRVYSLAPADYIFQVGHRLSPAK